MREEEERSARQRGIMVIMFAYTPWRSCPDRFFVWAHHEMRSLSFFLVLLLLPCCVLSLDANSFQLLPLSRQVFFLFSITSLSFFVCLFVLTTPTQCFFSIRLLLRMLLGSQYAKSLQFRSSFLSCLACGLSRSSDLFVWAFVCVCFFFGLLFRLLALSS